jgi:integrase
LSVALAEPVRCSTCAAMWTEIQSLRRTVAHQSRLLENLAPETSPAAPSVNCCYWLYSLAHEHTKSWNMHRNRLLPSLRGLGQLPAPDVTPVAWARHLAVRRAEGTSCAHTRNIELGRLKGMLDWAVEMNIIAFNPLRAAKREKARSQRETKLSPADIERLLIEAETIRDRRLPEEDDDGSRAKMLQAAILIWHDSMLRPNEGRNLRWSLIQPNGDYEIPRDTTKTDAGERTVTLTERTMAALAALPRHPDSDYVFTNQKTGRLLSYGTLRGWFRWTCAGSRMDAKAAPRDKRLTPHMLRHSGATTADANGVRSGALQTQLGHKNPAATARYIHRDKVESARHVAEIMTAATRRGPKRKK